MPCREWIASFCRCFRKHSAPPALFTFFLVLLAFNELYYAKQECSVVEVNDYDAQWLIRSAMMLAMPLTFALTMESYPIVGDLVGLSFRVNERSPPIFCGWESMVPALLVGEGLVFVTVALCWLICAPAPALAFLVVGVDLSIAGYGLSLYLRQPEWNCFQSATRREETEGAATDPSDSNQTTCANEHDIEATGAETKDLPLEEGSSAQSMEEEAESERPQLAPKGKSLGAFNFSKLQPPIQSDSSR